MTSGFLGSLTFYNLTSRSCLLVLLNVLYRIGSAQGDCWNVHVSGASYNARINGNYYWIAYCNGRSVWKQQDYAYDNYVAYAYDGFTSEWVVKYGNIGCGYGSILARNRNSYGYSVPYNLPGYWDEWNGIDYSQNVYFEVTCADDDLNGWEIFGIVIACICGVALIIALVAAICHHKKKKQKRSAGHSQPAQPRSAAVYDNAGGAVTVTTISSTVPPPQGYINPTYPPQNNAPYPVPTEPVYNTIIYPPSYDGTPAPAYTPSANQAVGHVYHTQY